MWLSVLDIADLLYYTIKIGSVLEDLLPFEEMQGTATTTNPSKQNRRVMVATEPAVRSAMLAGMLAFRRSAMPLSVVGCVHNSVLIFRTRNCLGHLNNYISEHSAQVIYHILELVYNSNLQSLPCELDFGDCTVVLVWI